MKNGFFKLAKSRFFLRKERNKILGFAMLVEDDNGRDAELRTLGVLPEYQGKGIGRSLLIHSLSRSFEIGYSTCHLSVAVTNDKALDLYLRNGFKIIEKYEIYRVVNA